MSRPKQLKHILTKWNLKKNVSPADMEVMLAIKRQRSAEEKPTQFTYCGHRVPEQKLERAAKRIKLQINTPNGAGETYIFLFQC